MQPPYGTQQFGYAQRPPPLPPQKRGGFPPLAIVGIVAAVLIGVLCGVVGTYVVLRGYAFLGDALAHATFPGVAVAYLLGTSILGGALVAGLITAFLIGGVSRNRRVSSDSAIGVLFAGAFALGVMLISRIRSYRKDLSSLLFGNVLGVSTADLVIICIMGALILAVVVVCYRELLLISFDPTYAASLGYPAWALDLLLLGILTLTFVLCLQVCGNLLVLSSVPTPHAAPPRPVAMLVVPHGSEPSKAWPGLVISSSSYHKHQNRDDLVTFTAQPRWRKAVSL